MKELPITEFDMLTLPQYIQLAKSIIPFIEFVTQQTMSAFLREYEFSCTMNYYNRPESLRMAACSTKPHLSLNSSIQDILGDERIISTVLKYSPDNFKNILSNIKSYNKMLYRKLIYTGVTRAKKKLVLIGEIDALDMAVQNNLSDERRTSLKEMLNRRIK